MITSLSRIIKFGWQNFWRNKWLAAATIIIMVMSLLVFESLILFSVVTKTAIDILKEKIDISVYFKPATPEQEILNIKKIIENFEEVEIVEYISKERALAVFKEKHQDDPTIKQAIEELEENPLSALINIKAKDPQQYSVIADKLDNNEWRPLIQKVTYRQNQVVIDRLGKIIDLGNKAGLIITIVLALVAIVVTFNTVGLAIYSNRDEIGIMRLVGAPNAFITGPYMVEGIIYGIIGAVVSTLIIWGVVAWGAPYLRFFLSELDLTAYFQKNFWALFGYQLLFGILLGVISSNFAIRKYLSI